MARSDITYEQALTLVDRVAGELGLLTSIKSGFYCVTGPTNKHRLYIQRSKFLNRIDFTVDLPPDDPAFEKPETENGSIRCHPKPDLVQLERCLRMLADDSLAKQVPNKPRPFAATKAPAPRRPVAVAPPVAPDPPASDEFAQRKAQLRERVDAIRAGARRAKIRKILENPETYGEVTEEEAARIADGEVEPDAFKRAQDAANAVEAAEVLAEAGIEVAG